MASEEQPDEVRRLGRHPRESPARRLEDYLDSGQLHLPPGSELDHEFFAEMGRRVLDVSSSELA